MHLPYAHHYPIQCPITFLGDYLLGEGTVRNVSTGGWRGDSGQTAHRPPLAEHPAIVLICFS